MLKEMNQRRHNMDEIKKTFAKVAAIIEGAKKKAYRKINEELINMYWCVGQFISEEAKIVSYGDSYIDELLDIYKIHFRESKDLIVVAYIE